MHASFLTSLAQAGVVERAGPRRTTLRVSPRFLAHAEGTAGRLRMLGIHADTWRVLEAALATWEGFEAGTAQSAHVLAELMDAREQMGALRSTFGGEPFAVAA